MMERRKQLTSFFENHLISAYISCVTGKPSLVTIEALSTATYIYFPYNVLLELFEKSMAWQKFGRLIAEYLGSSQFKNTLRKVDNPIMKCDNFKCTPSLNNPFYFPEIY